MPENELPFAASLVYDGRAVARFFSAQRPPKLCAGVFVESDDRAAQPAGQAKQTLAIQQRVPGKAPHRGFDAEILLELPRPEDLSLVRIEAEQIPLGAQRIDLAVADHWRDARPGGIADGV